MPGIQTRETTIGDCVYRVTQFGSLQGNPVLLRLMRSIGAGFKLNTDGTMDGTDIGIDFGSALKALTDEDFAFVCREFATHTRVTIPDEENAPKTHRLTVIYDQHFAGRYTEQFAWLVFAVEVNYGNFFGELAAMFARRAAASRSTSPRTQTGSSGDSSPEATA